MKTLLILVSLSSLYISLSAQQDTLEGKLLNNIVVKGYRFNETAAKLSEVHGTYIIGGHKSEVLQVQDLPANLAEKTGRQLFAKVPGAFIYDMDGSGNQINVSTRGLDAHRSWEFNVRQDGVMINSDIYGYPASHYSMPMEAIKNIELVRGTASLQYGAEFGGMLNYTIKEPDTTKPISIELNNSVGSYGLLSTYNAIGGKTGHLTYYGYFHRRVSTGYRDHADSKAQAEFINLQYQFSEKLNLRLEFGRSEYLYHIPGALTDSMFVADPRQSTRTRNYFSPDIYVPSLRLQYKWTDHTLLECTLSGVFGTRNSVEFEGFADKADVIDPVTLQYKPRVVNIDHFNSKTSEARLLHHYTIGRYSNTVSAGLTYFNNNLHRQQQGPGTTGTDYDLTITGPWGRDLFYKSQSIAFYFENLVHITPSLSVAPGFRYEYGNTNMSGYISYLDPEDIPNTIQHNVPSLGINAQYLFKDGTRLYGGISQAYRPVLFKDIIPSSTLERANKNLEDAFGYNMELGINGKVDAVLKYDITLFRIRYNNRLGSLVIHENDKDYIYKTNIGDSETNGAEIFIEGIPYQSNKLYVSLFTSTSFMKATYINSKLAVGNINVDITGNEVESVPHVISRNGINVGYKIFRVLFQYSYVGQSFSDPINTETPSANGAKGIVPAYGLFDLNMSLRFSGHVMLKAGINNLADNQYFTKRPLFYPGPGVWSSDGRSFVVSLGVKI
ncbi:MAG TPA: TonB-dependent receptor [Saprospiraceae bacterium]|nr:TonB-dependent receptor [Saprospiraceae bacterium]